MLLSTMVGASDPMPNISKLGLVAASCHPWAGRATHVGQTCPATSIGRMYVHTLYVVQWTVKKGLSHRIQGCL